MHKLQPILIMLFIIYPGFSIADEWNEETKTAFIDGCVQGVLEPAKEDYHKRAAEKGNPDAEFPEEKITPPIKEMCTCITNRAISNWSYDEFFSTAAYQQQLVEDAITGKECAVQDIFKNKNNQ